MKNLFIYKFIIAALLMQLWGGQMQAYNVTRPNINFYGGLAVNSYTGNLFFQRNDLTLPGVGPSVDMTFAFNSSHREDDQGFGLGWTFSQNLFYYPDSQGVWLSLGTGKLHLFVENAGAYHAPPGVFDCFENYGPGLWRLSSPTGMIYYFEDSTHKHLTRIKDPNGNEVFLTYQNGKLDEISNAVGRKLRFLWQNDHLHSVQDMSSSPVRSWEFSYKDDFLISVKNPLNHQQNYGYDQDGKLISIRLYDDNQMFIGYHKGDVVAEIASCDFHDYFTYEREAHKTFHIKETDDGSIIDTYEFDEDGNLIRKKGSCCGYDMGYTYDGDLNVTEIVNGEGNLTSFTYDQWGNQTSSTGPSGYPTLKTYASGTNWLTSITDRRGNTTSIMRDSVGNILEVIYPEGINKRYIYDKNGNLIYFTDGKGFSTSYEYDSLGNLMKIKEPLGREQSFIYDKRGNVIEEVDARGHKTYFEYDLLDRLVKTTNSLGNAYVWRYDPDGRLLSEINPLGDSTNFGYDPLGRLIEEKGPEGVIYKYRYNKRGLRIATIDPLGNTRRYRYNNRNQKVAETDPLGNTTRFEYNGVGQIVRRIDPLGNIASFVYNAAGLMVQHTNEAGEVLQFGYDEEGNRISATDPLGNITLFEYDRLGRKIKEIDALGNSSQFYYDQNDHLISMKDPLGRRTFYEYDSLDRLTKIIDPKGDSVQMKYDLNDNLISRILPNGDSSSIIYNELNLPITEKDILGLPIKKYYDELERLVRVEDRGGNRFKLTYDKASRVIEIRDSLGLLESNVYNSRGNIVEQTTPWGQVNTFEYDALGREVKLIDPTGGEQKLVYDALGRLIKEINSSGNSFQFTYDPVGRILEEENELGHKNTYRYDGNGNIIGVTDPLGRTTHFIYDAANRKISEILPDNSQANFTYDAAGQLISTTNRNGQTVQFFYDLKGRVTKKKYPGTREDLFTYDAIGNLLSAVNPWAHVSFTYDVSGDILSESCRNKTSSYSYGNTYDSFQINYPSGKKINYEIDIRNRLKNISENGITHASYTYNNDNAPVSVLLGNGLRTDYAYDSFRRFSQIQHDTLLNFAYSYTQEGLLDTEENLKRNQLSRKFQYDANNRLISTLKGLIQNGQISNPTSSKQFSYDAVGNRSSSTLNNQSTSYQIDAKNAYTRVGSQNFVLDTQGNLLSDGNLQYIYDIDNKLIEVRRSGNLLAKYNYDALGRRTQKITPQDTIYFYYSFSEIIEERDERDTLLASYVYSSEFDDIIYASINGQDYYYHTDWQGSVRAISDDAGHGIEYYEYDAYGNRNIYDSQFQFIANSQVKNPYGFTGRRHESETGLIFYRNRSYHPQIGRFLQPDPLGYVDGPNMYKFAMNSPLNYKDPFGLSAESGISFKRWFEDWYNGFYDPSKGSVTLDGFNFTLLSIPIGLSIFSIEGSFGGTLQFCCDPYFNEINLDVNISAGIGLELAFGKGEDYSEKRKDLRRKKHLTPWEKRHKYTNPKKFRQIIAQKRRDFIREMDEGGKPNNRTGGKRKKGRKTRGIKKKGKRDRLKEKFDKEIQREIDGIKREKRVSFKPPSFASEFPTCPTVEYYGFIYQGYGFTFEIAGAAGLFGVGAVFKYAVTFGPNDKPTRDKIFSWDNVSHSYGHVGYKGLKIAIVGKGQVFVGGVIATRIKPGFFGQ